MTALISWYLIVSLLGWITFPLSYRLFSALSDRGYVLSRAFGLLVWGYVFWMFASLGIAQNDTGGLLLALAVLVGLSAWIFVNHKSYILNWLDENRRLVLATEFLFLIAFGIFAFFRSGNPEIVGTEKPMELMFINGIMNSPAFPPRDLWLSGYAISYYYFGYVLTAMLAKFTGVPATMAFNLMLSLTYGLAALGAYGILYNLLTSMDHDSKGEEKDRRSLSSVPGLSFLGPLFLLLISNIEGFLEILHRKGFFWSFNADGSASSAFWKWLDMQELSQAPVQPLAWTPDRYLWWWRASRVVQDYDLANRRLEAIDEFPAFSFLLGDLHPHVLTIPFLLLAVSIALNLFLGGWRGRMNLYAGQLHIDKEGFFVMAFMIGALAFLNTWDILPGAALIVFSYALARVREAGWGRKRIEDVVLLGVPLVIAAYILFFPFFISFHSQAGGILPSIPFATRGAHLWVMWGALFVPIFGFLIYLLRAKAPANWRAGFGFGLGIVLVLVALMSGIYFLVCKLRPEAALPQIQEEGYNVASFFAAGMVRRLSYIGGLITILALLIPSLSFLFAKPASSSNDQAFLLPASSFLLLLTSLGTLLILGPDFLYLQDNFGYRINTIFKFYYQAWILLSLASACGTAVLLRRLRGAANGIFSVIFIVVLIVGLPFPILGALTRTNKFNPSAGYYLDDFERVQRENPDEAAAILWLKSAPDGILLEATGDPYSSIGRISIYSGLPTVLGWGNHEGQWRDSSEWGVLDQRKRDIELFYSTPDWQATKLIIDQYHVRYVIVGNLERSTYRVNEKKFNDFLRIGFRQGNITVYEVP